MSAVASICKASKQRGNALVLLLLLKTWDGAEAPDHYELAEHAHISPRQAERDLSKLVEDGDVERLSPEHNGGRGHKTRYRVRGVASTDAVAQTTSHLSESDKTPTDVTDFRAVESPSEVAEIPETTTDVTDLSDSKGVKSDGVPPANYVTSVGTPIAPLRLENTSTDNHSSASLRNVVGRMADAGSVEQRARLLRRAIAQLPKHKRCAQPTDEEWALMLDIFGEWKREVGKNGNAKLTPERGRAVLDRLRSPVGFTREDFSNAIKGCRASPTHMGDNDRGTVYNDLELICRSDQNLERFIGYLQTPEGNGSDAKQRTPTQNFGRPPVTRDFTKYPARTRQG